MDPLVSIILPVHNQEQYIDDAIKSVQNQSYSNWELLIIDDGSDDKTPQILNEIKDSRIQVFKQQRSGVSHARNSGLNAMKGNYFCFLDADDILTESSIESRVIKFQMDPGISFVDGVVEVYNTNYEHLGFKYKPSFEGQPLREILKFSGSCFFGNSWMFKNEGKDYSFRKLSHGEDLMFCIDYGKEGKYTHVHETILKVRKTKGSAMTDLKGLATGYKRIFEYISLMKELSNKEKREIKGKLKKIIIKSFLKGGKYLDAVNMIKW